MRGALAARLDFDTALRAGSITGGRSSSGWRSFGPQGLPSRSDSIRAARGAGLGTTGRVHVPFQCLNGIMVSSDFWTYDNGVSIQIVFQCLNGIMVSSDGWKG